MNARKAKMIRKATKLDTLKNRTEDTLRVVKNGQKKAYVINEKKEIELKVVPTTQIVNTVLGPYRRLKKDVELNQRLVGE